MGKRKEASRGTNTARLRNKQTDSCLFPGRLSAFLIVQQSAVFSFSRLRGWLPRNVFKSPASDDIYRRHKELQARNKVLKTKNKQTPWKIDFLILRAARGCQSPDRDSGKRKVGDKNISAIKK